MIKKLTFAFLLISVSLFGQKKFTNSIHADFTGNQIDGDGYAGYKHIGFHVGIGTQYKFENSKNRLGFEINYAQKGSRQRQNLKRGILNDFKMYLNYVEVPVLYIFPKWGIHFEVGPTFSYLISSKEAFNNIETTPEFPYKKFEVGGMLSANFKIIDQLYLKFRIMNSITSIRDVNVSTTGYFWQVGAFHRSGGLNLTYYFSPPELGDKGEIDIP